MRPRLNSYLPVLLRRYHTVKPTPTPLTPSKPSTVALSEQVYPLHGYYKLILHSSLQSPHKHAVPTPSSASANASEDASAFDTVPLSAPKQDPSIVFSSRLNTPKRDHVEILVKEGKLPPKPVEPDNCCMSGCVHCVWDIYREEYESWSLAAKKLQPNESQIESELSKKEGWETQQDIPIPIREFMKSEKRLQQQAQEREAKELAEKKAEEERKVKEEEEKKKREEEEARKVLEAAKQKAKEALEAEQKAKAIEAEKAKAAEAERAKAAEAEKSKREPVVWDTVKQEVKPKKTTRTKKTKVVPEKVVEAVKEALPKDANVSEPDVRKIAEKIFETIKAEKIFDTVKATPRVAVASKPASTVVESVVEAAQELPKAAEKVKEAVVEKIEQVKEALPQEVKEVTEKIFDTIKNNPPFDTVKAVAKKSNGNGVKKAVKQAVKTAVAETTETTEATENVDVDAQEVVEIVKEKVKSPKKKKKSKAKKEAAAQQEPKKDTVKIEIVPEDQVEKPYTVEPTAQHPQVEIVSSKLNPAAEPFIPAKQKATPDKEEKGLKEEDKNEPKAEERKELKEKDESAELGPNMKKWLEESEKKKKKKAKKERKEKKDGSDDEKDDKKYKKEKKEKKYKKDDKKYEKKKVEEKEKHDKDD